MRRTGNTWRSWRGFAVNVLPTWYHWLAGECVPHMDLFLRLMLSMGMGLVMKGPTGQITVIRPRKMDVSEKGGENTT